MYLEAEWYREVSSSSVGILESGINLLLQVSTQLSQVGTVLYVSGEESAQQIKLRAERLGDIDSEFYLYAETNMQSVRAEVERIQPDFLIIDSHSDHYGLLRFQGCRDLFLKCVR